MRAFIFFSIERYLEPTGAMTRACLAIMVLAMAEASIFKRIWMNVSNTSRAFFFRGWLVMDSMDAMHHVKLNVVCAVDVVDMVVLLSSPFR